MPYPRDTTLPRTGLTLEQARDKLSGWHFAKEVLTQGERDILYIAEGLLRLIDDTTPAPTEDPSPVFDGDPCESCHRPTFWNGSEWTCGATCPGPSR